MIDAGREDVRRYIPWIKWRLYRFSDDLAAHVVAEVVEDRVRRGAPLPTTVERALGGFLSGHRRDGSVPLQSDRCAELLGVDPSAEIAARLSLESRHKTSRAPDRVLCVIGAPRSGTSNLLNRLVHETEWATFTDHSHHLWPTSQLGAARRRFLRAHSSDLLARDTTEARLDPQYSWPSEAENIFHRAAPVYAHAGGHRYKLHALRDNDDDLLRNAVNAHLRYFDSDTLVVKSPFHVLRLGWMKEVIGGRWLVVHVVRDHVAVASSIERNEFGYHVDNDWLTPTEAAAWFTQRATMVADVTVRHDDLRTRPDRTVHKLIREVDNAC